MLRRGFGAFSYRVGSTSGSWHARLPAPSQTVSGGHPLELNTAKAEELTGRSVNSMRPKLSAAVSEVKSVSDRSEKPYTELGATGQPSVRPNQSVRFFQVFFV